MRIEAIKIGILAVSDSPRAVIMLNTAVSAIEKVMKKTDAEIVEQKIVPCEAEEIEWELRRLCEYVHVDLVLTLGSMGIGPRDITPDCTSAIIECRLDGVELAMRLALMEDWPQSMLSRAVCGIHNRTLVINLPEEPDQITRCLEALAATLPLAIYAIKSHAAVNE